MLLAQEFPFPKHWHKAEAVLRLRSIMVKSTSLGPDQVSARLSQPHYTGQISGSPSSFGWLFHVWRYSHVPAVDGKLQPHPRHRTCASLIRCTHWAISSQASNEWKQALQAASISLALGDGRHWQASSFLRPQWRQGQVPDVQEASIQQVQVSSINGWVHQLPQQAG